MAGGARARDHECGRVQHGLRIEPELIEKIAHDVHEGPLHVGEEIAAVDAVGHELLGAAQQLFATAATRHQAHADLD